jgi:toxin ParE1/3/4
MNKLDVLSIARAEFKEATNWYLDQSSAAAERFVSEVEFAFDSIQSHPTQHLRWNNKYRYYIVNAFPYYVPYRMTSGGIVVVAVFHTSRDASAWTNR